MIYFRAALWDITYVNIVRLQGLPSQRSRDGVCVDDLAIVIHDRYAFETEPWSDKILHIDRLELNVENMLRIGTREPY